MTTANSKNLSPFAQHALALDAEFSQLDRLSGELERLPIETDNGLERARLLLALFGECGERVGVEIQALAAALSEAQARAEKAAQAVQARALVVQARQSESDRLVQRFQALGEMTRKVTETVSQLQSRNPGQALSREEKQALLDRLPEVEQKLGVLIDEAQQIREEAQAANLRNLEKNAEAMSQSMRAMRMKLSGLVGRVPSDKAG